MKIEKIGNLYIIKGHAQSHYFTAYGLTIGQALTQLMREIAIQRSLSAWSR